MPADVAVEADMRSFSRPIFPAGEVLKKDDGTRLLIHFLAEAPVGVPLTTEKGSSLLRKTEAVVLLGGRVELDATRMADQARKAGPLIVTEIPHPYWFGEKRNAKTQDLMAGAKAAEGSGRYAEALRLYEAAYLLTERTGYLLRLADMRALLGHHTIAAALYHRVASDKYSHPSEREEAAEKIERLALDEEQLRTMRSTIPKPAAAAPAAAKPGLLRKLSFSRDRKGSTSAAAAPAAAPPANGSAAAPPPKVGALRRTLSFGSGSKGQGSGRRASAGDAGRTTAPIGGGRTAAPAPPPRAATAASSTAAQPAPAPAPAPAAPGALRRTLSFGSKPRSREPAPESPSAAPPPFLAQFVIPPRATSDRARDLDSQKNKVAIAGLESYLTKMSSTDLGAPPVIPSAPAAALATMSLAPAPQPRKSLSLASTGSRDSGGSMKFGRKSLTDGGTSGRSSEGTSGPSAGAAAAVRVSAPTPPTPQEPGDGAARVAAPPKAAVPPGHPPPLHDFAPTEWAPSYAAPPPQPGLAPVRAAAPPPQQPAPSSGEAAAPKKLGSGLMRKLSFGRDKNKAPPRTGPPTGAATSAPLRGVSKEELDGAPPYLATKRVSSGDGLGDDELDDYLAQLELNHDAEKAAFEERSP